MIRRSLAELYESIREFFVAVDADNQVVGCAALHVFWEDLSEIRCLAVAEHVQGMGVGRHLVEACWELARELEVTSVFALTNATGFFERCGYRQIDKSELPQRIWSECVRCPSFPNCAEIALIRSAETEPAASTQSAEPRHRRDLTRTARREPDGGRASESPPESSALSYVAGMSKARARALLGSVGVFVVTMLLMLATEPRMAIGWDEGYTLGREQRLRDWFRGLRDPTRFAAEWRPLPLDEDLVQRDAATPPPRPSQLDTRTKLLFDHDVLVWFWPFAREEPHGHPPFYALVGLIGDLLAPSWQDLPRARLGPILFFSLTAGVVFFFSVTRWGLWPAVLAAGSWVLQPNLFGHGHYASYDGLLTSLWVLSVIVFAQAAAPESSSSGHRIRWLPSVVFGIVLGCAAATKLTGWFVPLPFLAWTGLYRSRQGLKTLAVGLLIAFVVLFALMPPWWSEPVSGVVRFLDSNLGRGKTIPIKIRFLGTVYDTPKQSLPWYNTLVWTLLVTPVGFLMMAGLGLGRALRHWRSESIGVLIAGHWVFLMILRALPHTPGHDGVRLFLPAFGMLALLSGLGARFLLEVWKRWAKVMVTAALLEGAVSIIVMMPVPLSYFSPIVAGLPGATALGMEPTYYWDALSPEARRWLAEHTAPGRTIAFSTFPQSWLYLRRIGELPRQLEHIDGVGQAQWIVMQNRPGSFSRGDRTLVGEGRPAYTVTKLGVALVWIFPFSEYERLEETRRR